MSDVWDAYNLERETVVRLNAGLACRCGARDWQATNPRGFWRWVWLRLTHQTRIAYGCRDCGAVVHLSLRQFKARTIKKG